MCIGTIAYNILDPVVTIAGMFGPVLRVILLPVPCQGGEGWGGGKHEQGQVNTLSGSTGSGAQMISQFLASAEGLGTLKPGSKSKRSFGATTFAGLY